MHFQALFVNPIFYSALLGWIGAQLMKAAIDIISRRKTAARGEVFEDDTFAQDPMAAVLWKTGGMPSSHSSMVSALTTAVGIREGIGSTVFIVTFSFAMVVLRDATGVRQTLGRLGHRYNTLVRVHNKLHPDAMLEPLKVSEGHSASEVLVGVLLGFFIAVTISLL